MSERCPACQGSLKRQAIERTRHVAGYAISAHLPAQICRTCGETYFAGADVAQSDHRVALLLAEAGITEPEALRFLRKVTGLQGKEFAQLLGVRPETVSRWEQGNAKIDRAAYAILRQLIQERQAGSSELVDYLRSLRKPRRLSKKVRLPEVA